MVQQVGVESKSVAGGTKKGLNRNLPLALNCSASEVNPESFFVASGISFDHLTFQFLLFVSIVLTIRVYTASLKTSNYSILSFPWSSVPLYLRLSKLIYYH